MAESIARREARIRELSQPLPGSRPVDQFKPIHVPAECDGATLLDALSRALRHLPESYWREEAARGMLLDVQGKPADLASLVRAGQRYLHRFESVVEPEVNADIRILHEDEALIVVHKPAPLPMHSGGRFHRNTLQHILEEAYRPQKPRAAHRLDGNTTGLVLFTRTRAFAAELQPQFARGEVHKVYLAQVQGHPPQDEFDCDAPISAEPGEAGSRRVDEDGLTARTTFRVLARHADGTATLEARPLTGRTNQIRIHLWHLGWPVCGDGTYLPGGRIGERQVTSTLDAPMRLHAWRMSFRHPLSGAAMECVAPPPAGFELP